MRATVDLRFNQAFPPIVRAGGAIPHDGVVYQGCGAPGQMCVSAQAPADVTSLVERMRGTTTGAIGMLAGDATADPTTAAAPPPSIWSSPIWNVIRLAAVCGGAYHGYRRHNGSIAWAFGWSLLGGIFWPVTIPVALAQGFGKPMRGR